MKIGDLSHRLAVAIILNGHLGRRKKEKDQKGPLRLIFLLRNLPFQFLLNDYTTFKWVIIMVIKSMNNHN
jgi:hypothetical protein